MLFLSLSLSVINKYTMVTCCGAYDKRIVTIWRRKFGFRAEKYSGPTDIDYTLQHHPSSSACNYVN